MRLRCLSDFLLQGWLPLIRATAIYLEPLNSPLQSANRAFLAMLSVLATGSVLLRPLRQLHPLPQQPRSARLVACADSDFHALPPAQKRDVAAELYAEVSSATSEIAADAAPPTPLRPLVALTVSEDGGLTLVGEHIQNITSGVLLPTRAHPRNYPRHAPARNTAGRTIPPLTVYS